MQAVTAPDHEQAERQARDYLNADLENQAEWWEHLGDAHRDYAALARAYLDLAAQLAERERESSRERMRSRR